MNKQYFIFIFIFFYFLESCNDKEKKGTETTISTNSLKDDYILLDSLKINNTESLFCFICVDYLGGGEKVYISISNNVCSISKDKALAEGNSIAGFSEKINNTIYIFGYEKPVIVDNFSRFSFEVRDLTDDKTLETYRKKHLKRVHQSKLCP